MSVLRALVIYLGLALPTLAQGLPDWITPYVSDFAEVLSPAEEARLTAKLERLRQDPGVEVAVVTVARLRDYGFESDIAKFSKDLFNQWGIGNSSRNDGALILVSTQDREVRIALGSGYSALWDARAQRVIDAIMLPLLTEGHYPAGLNAGLDGLERHVLRPHRDGVAFVGTEDMPEPPSEGILDKLLFGAVIAFVLGTIGWQQRHRYADRIAVRRGCPSCGSKRVVLQVNDDPAMGLKTIRRECLECGWHSSRDEDLTSRQSGEDGGGSEGFGGGGSSGGGASGRY